MTLTLDEIGLFEPQEKAWKALFDRASSSLIDQPNEKPIPQLAAHWQRQRDLDQAVNAIRRRDPNALTIINILEQTPAIFAGLLTLLIRSNQDIGTNLTPALA